MIFFISSAYAADVVYFDSYNTENVLADNRIKVKKEISLGNEGSNPIIPGVMHFEVYEFKGKKRVASEIDNLYAHNQGERLVVNVEEYTDYTDIIVDVWNPLLPDFKFPLTMTYDVLYDKKGVLFHVTYAPKSEITKDDLYTIVEWDNPEEDVMIEYSSLPFPRMPFKSSTLFWLVVIILLLFATYFYSKKLKENKI